MLRKNRSLVWARINITNWLYLWHSHRAFRETIIRARIWREMGDLGEGAASVQVSLCLC